MGDMTTAITGGSLKQIVPLLAGVICVAALTGCPIAIMFETPPTWKTDQMIGVPLETQKGEVIRTARMLLSDGGQFIYQWRYGGLTPDGRVIIGFEFYCTPGAGCVPRDIKYSHQSIEERNKLFSREKRFIYILDASPSTLKYELAARVDKFWGIEHLRECLGPSGEKRNEPPCWSGIRNKPQDKP